LPSAKDRRENGADGALSPGSPKVGFDAGEYLDASVMCLSPFYV